MARLSSLPHRLLVELLEGGGSAWQRELEPLLGTGAVAVHLAVLIEPYLQYVLDGSKTVESRFSRHAIAPYGQVAAGDAIVLKGSSRPATGLCRVREVWEYELDPRSWREIRRFATALQAQGDFWERRQHARYATLLALEGVQEMPAAAITKRDRRGWVVLSGAKFDQRP